LIDLEEKETWPDGRVCWVSSTKIPLRDAAGRIVGTFGVSRDITARKQSEQQNRELLIQLQLAQKLESIGRLAAGIAHEINTPTQFITDNAHFLTNTFTDLTKVLEAARALRDAAKSEPTLAAAADQFTSVEQGVELNYLLAEIPSTLKQSLDGLGRVARIVRSLKEFSHPSNAHRGATDLNRVIATAITVSRHEWKYVAEVVTDLSPDLPPVPCVVDEFNQVILNLLVNAAHAIESAQQQKNTPGAPGTITVRTRLDGKWALIEIEDTGTGIPEEIRERIFDPFFTTKPVGKGTGQGLTIVQNVIVKNHRGTIDVTSVIGQGTVFHIRLPLAAEHIST
jgi:signal transduction histidine kinase